MSQVQQQTAMEVDHQIEARHFVLVHGACHGAWCWHKVKPNLEAAGHRVTALDMAASGINMKRIDEVHSVYDYSQPLLEMVASLPPSEKVILVGHSFGGMSLALAMENFPEKISVAVFVTAFMPDTLHKPSYVLDQAVESSSPEEQMDTEFTPDSFFFGPNYLSAKLYQRSSREDLELAFALTRRTSLFLEDLAKSENFSKEKYGSVSIVFIKCDEDECIKPAFQQWMIENNGGVKEVMNIPGADHMAMLSTPHELCLCLCKVARNFI